MARKRLAPAATQCAFCGAPLPPQTGPGRPRRFCSDVHRAAAAMGMRWTPDDELAWLNGRRGGRPLQDPEIAELDGWPQKSTRPDALSSPPSEPEPPVGRCAECGGPLPATPAARAAAGSCDACRRLAMEVIADAD